MIGIVGEWPKYRQAERPRITYASQASLLSHLAARSGHSPVLCRQHINNVTWEAADKPPGGARNRKGGSGGCFFVPESRATLATPAWYLVIRECQARSSKSLFPCLPFPVVRVFFLRLAHSLPISVSSFKPTCLNFGTLAFPSPTRDKRD